MATTKTTTTKTVKTVTVGDAVETPETPETQEAPQTNGNSLARGLGRLVGRAKKAHKNRNATTTRVAMWTPDCTRPGALRADILVSLGERIAVIDTGDGLKSIPVSAICSIR